MEFVENTNKRQLYLLLNQKEKKKLEPSSDTICHSALQLSHLTDKSSRVLSSSILSPQMYLDVPD